MQQVLYNNLKCQSKCFFHHSPHTTAKCYTICTDTSHTAECCYIRKSKHKNAKLATTVSGCMVSSKQPLFAHWTLCSDSSTLAKQSQERSHTPKATAAAYIWSAYHTIFLRYPPRHPASLPSPLQPLSAPPF